MLYHVVFAVFLIFQLSANISWNPCPPLRSTFQDISIDNDGRKRPNCVCKNNLFGDECQFKVYVSFNKTQHSNGKNSRQADIYPLEYLKLIQRPDKSVMISWKHSTLVFVEYYVVQFRELRDDEGLIRSEPWRTLAYIMSKNFYNKDLMSYEFDNFYNYTMYEINLGIFSHDDVIVSVSVLHDVWRVESFQNVLLHDVIFTAGVTWSHWSTWGTCETQHGCGRGKQTRSRVLVTKHCLNEKREENRPCKLKSCPVNGGWSVWSIWSQCSVTCDNGTRLRQRTCTSPAPSRGGELCHGIHQINQTCINEACSENLSESGFSTWSPVVKLRSLEFTSLILGFAAGFTACLVITACPQIVKRYARRFREKYKPLETKDLSNVESGKTSEVTPKQTSSNSTPLAPPPPALNWRPIPRVEPVLPMVLPSSPQPTQPKHNVWKHTNVTHQMQMANNLFMDELLKAFKTFNVNTNNKIGNPSEKRPP